MKLERRMLIPTKLKMEDIESYEIRKDDAESYETRKENIESYETKDGGH